MTGDAEAVEVRHFDYGHGQRVDDEDVELYEMSRMSASDAVQRAKAMYADENDSRMSKLVGRKLYRRTGSHRDSRTYVVVAEKGDLR